VAVIAALIGLAAGAVLLATLRRPAAPPSFTQLTFRRGAILSARFSQDGQTVVYSAAWHGQPAQVYTTRIGSHEDRPLGVEGTVLSVSCRDEVALKLGRFLGSGWSGAKQRGTLARVSLAGGVPRELVENVVAADWDPEGRELAVVRGGRLEYPIGHVLYRGDLFAVRVLPGNRFAILESDEIGQGRYRFGISLIDRAGRRTVLSPGWRYWWNVSWSPASREVLFVSRRVDDYGLHAVSPAGRERLVARIPGDFELHDVDARGRLLLEQRFRRGQVAGVPPGESRERDLSWLDFTGASDLSADGRHLLLGGWSPISEGTEGSYLRRTDGSAAVRLGDENGLAISPDGRFVLALPPEQDYADRLVLIPTAAGERRELRHGSLLFFEDGNAWFPDGRRLAVVGSEARGGQRRLYIWDLESGAPPRPLSPEGDLQSPVVSADGQWVAVQTGVSGVVVCPVDGDAARVLPGSNAGDIPLRWSGDGRWLYVQRGGDADPMPSGIDRIEIASGVRQAWKDLMPSDPSGVLGVWRVFVTPDGSSYAYQFGSSVGRLYLAEGLR
jgi:hypothetical protein